MNFKITELSDKAITEPYIAAAAPIGSHQNFTNNYIWQESYHIEYTISDDMLVFKGRHHRQNPYYLFPMGSADPLPALKNIIAYANDNGYKCVFANLTNNEADFIEKNFSGRFTFEEHRHSEDYVYEISKLISLSGKKLHSKKNHLNKFLKTYNYVYSDINPENIETARNFCLSMLDAYSDREEEKLSVNKLFDAYEELALDGAIIFVDGNPVAVTAGEPLNDDTVLIHLEKADELYAGSYAAINNLFLKNKYSDFRFVNREEDMGIEGLRRAKLSYRPYRMIEKIIAIEI